MCRAESLAKTILMRWEEWWLSVFKSRKVEIFKHFHNGVAQCKTEDTTISFRKSHHESLKRRILDVAIGEPRIEQVEKSRSCYRSK